MERRLVNVRLTPEIVECWLKSTGDECMYYSIEGVPQDSKMLDIHYNFQEAIFYVVFSHESFRDLEIGEKLPTITPRITKYFV